MPTPVNAARQCLTEHAAQALDEAVAVARRRGHSQTTSLHLVSALLSLPSCALREACGRARNNAYSSRIQFKALELSLGVSLDRMPSSPPQKAEEPLVSNSLMAAIKRSQASQRRQPENFNLYQQQQQQCSSSSPISIVKVELQNLIVSILDDPVVSRVFGEAGFRSYDIKLAILRPVHQLFRYSKYKGPPMFLCNLGGDLDLSHRAFTFPFLGFPGFLESDENCRRIGEVLVKKKGRNPLLVGFCANDALTSFVEMVQRRKGGGVLPVEVSGLSIIHVENEILKFAAGNCDEGLVKAKFEELLRMVEDCVGPGVVVNFGELKVLVDGGASVDAVSFIIRELGRLLELHRGKVWLIGVAARYETYMKFLNRFPSIEKDWDLQFLPITSNGPSMKDSFPRSSLMENFVPLGGFFSTPSSMKSHLSSSYNYVLQCHLSNGKYEQELAALSTGTLNASIAGHHESSLPSWSQIVEHDTNDGLGVAKAKDDTMVLSAKSAGLERKCDKYCQHLHFTQPLPKGNTYDEGSQVPTIPGFQATEGMKENVSDHSSHDANVSSTESRCKNKALCMLTDCRQVSTSKPRSRLGVLSEFTNVNLHSEPCEKPSKSEYELCDLRTSRSLSGSSGGESQTSPTSVTSVTTDLGLGICSVSMRGELEKSANQTHTECQQHLSGHPLPNVDVFTGNISDHSTQSSSSSYFDFHGKFDQKDFKTLYMALSEKVSHQESAVSVISQTIARCRSRNERHHGSRRGDIWFHFLGPDRFGKKKIGLALAEILYGTRQNFICVDLSFQNGIIDANTILNHQDMSCYSVKFRGKTVVDYIAEELSKKPLSVIFLENIDKADLLAQCSLSRAVKTGKFLDSYGREVGTSNSIFVTSSRFSEVGNSLSAARVTKYTEENILRLKGWPIQISVGFDLGDDFINHNLRVSAAVRKCGSDLTFMNKRKLIGSNETTEQHENPEMAKKAHKVSNLYLDLNLPAEETEMCDADNGNSDSDFISENSQAWLKHFLGEVDETVVFKSFDFDALAEKLLKEISGCLHKIVGLECLLEIDSKVMDQIIAAAYSSDSARVEDWIWQVLSRGFVETQKRYNLSAHSVVKLLTCEDLLPEDQTPDVFLPSRIIVN